MDDESLAIAAFVGCAAPILIIACGVAVIVGGGTIVWWVLGPIVGV